MRSTANTIGRVVFVERRTLLYNRPMSVRKRRPRLRRDSVYRISVDTGGTFTDVVVADGSGIRSIGKALTTPVRIFDGIRAALDVAAGEIGLSGSELLARSSLLIYGTTRATNAVVTGGTAKTAFLTTKGFKDILLFKEGGKYDPHDFSYDYPAPYIPRRYTYEIDERIDSEGGVVQTLDEQRARRVVRELKRQRFEAVAVCLLWSIANGVHERALAKILDEELPGVPYTLSHKLIPIVREYRRASTTAIDASLKPLMQEHLQHMHSDLQKAGFAGEILISTSGGGVQHLFEVATRPVRILKSGPAMAPVAGKAYATIENLGRNAIVCDTGGTTFDVALVRNGSLTYTRDSWIGRPKTGHIVALSSVDVRSIGAGGGSIAWKDIGGMLRVGPQSAGAAPGPACYGRGGNNPTVTDACLVLGYVDPAYFNGGRMQLDAKAAHRVISALAKKTGTSAEEAAHAVLTIANDHMTKAIREITVNEGIDPKESIIVAGGGAAGLNIACIAGELGCSTVIVPKAASAMSACGMQYSDIVFEETRSRVTRSDNFDANGVNGALAAVDRALEQFRKDLRGIQSVRHRKEFFVEARYKGQVWELDIPLPVRSFTSGNDVRKLVEAFHKMHERMYAVRDEGSAIECINWRGRLSLGIGKPVRPFPKSAARSMARVRGMRDAYFAGKKHRTPIYRGDTLPSGAHIQGPAIIEEPTTTIVVPPRTSARVSPSGNYILTV